MPFGGHFGWWHSYRAPLILAAGLWNFRHCLAYAPTQAGLGKFLVLWMLAHRDDDGMALKCFDFCAVCSICWSISKVIIDYRRWSGRVWTRFCSICTGTCWNTLIDRESDCDSYQKKCIDEYWVHDEDNFKLENGGNFEFLIFCVRTSLRNGK